MNHEFEDRIESLEGRMSELERGIIGSVDKPGMMELVRKTSDTVMIMNTTVQELKDDKMKFKGAFVAVGLLCGFIGWVTSVIFK